MYQPSVPFQPKHPDGKLRAIVIGRISTEHQKEESIDASFRYVREYLARIYDGPAEIEYLGERASGMLADRATIRQAEELISSRRIDLVIAEDLSRIYRNPRLQYDFVQNAVDHGWRVICIADNLDTATDHWRLGDPFAFACSAFCSFSTFGRVGRGACHSAGSQSLRSLATSCAFLELRPLCSAGVTRLRRYYGPLRHPARSSLLLAESSLPVTHRDRRGFPCFVSLPLADMPSPLPRWDRRAFIAQSFRLSAGGTRPRDSSLRRQMTGSAPTLRISRLAQRSLLLRPVDSLTPQGRFFLQCFSPIRLPP